MLLKRIFHRFAPGLLVMLAATGAGIATPANAQTQPQLLPYTSVLVAGGGAAIAKNTACPSGVGTSTDAYGDGCLATEVLLTSAGAHIYYGEFAGYAVADSTGAVFFSDGYNGLIRRVDPVTGIVTAVAGGASSNPGANSACGANVSTDANGDGCLSTAVKLTNPGPLAFDAAGNLYFGDVGKYNIRKIAATGGFIPATGGIITNVLGQTTYGYKVNNSAGGPVLASASYSDEPFGLAFDAAGNLYFSDEGENAIEVINLTGSDETLQGVHIPAGTVEKLVGYKAGECPSFTSTSSTAARGGCAYANFTEGTAGMVSNTDSPYQIAVVPGTTAANAGYIYVANEYPDHVFQVNSSNIDNNYAGIAGSASVEPNTKRAAAGSFSIGSPFGVAADPYGNVYVTDASAGVIWRVDQGTKSMYAVGGGASSVCQGATDTYGDGCPALQAKFGADPGSSGYVSAAAPPAPGIFGVNVDPFGNLFFGDTETNLIREVATGAQFGAVGANQPTNTLDIHFPPNDGPAASGAYALTAGASNFSLGTASCTTNSDNTTDCLLPVTATPSVIGPFSGTLTVTSAQGATNAFPLTGTFIQSPLTRTAVSYTTNATCAGVTTYATTTTFNVTATLAANGPSAPGGTITFYANGTQIGQAQNVSNIGTSSNPVYGAKLSNTFSTPGSYSITATYSGDSYFHGSTGKTSSFSTSTAGFTAAVTPYAESTVAAGQTALYSFTVTQNVYTGTITFACSNLPAGAACNFSPSSLTATGCSTTSTVALSITTTGPVINAGIGSSGPRGWQAITMLAGIGLALLVGLRRRLGPGLRVACMAAGMLLVTLGATGCSSNTVHPNVTPSGTSTVTVTLTGSNASGSTTINVPLTVK